jgi:hypothetical protein
LMHLPEGRPSEGTGHGSDRATGGTGFGPFWHPAKRRSAFSEAGGCSRTARRSRRRFERALTYGARFRAGAGRPRKGSAARQGAGKPVSRLTRFISQGIVCCCAFRSARERCRHSIYRALRPWPSAADGKDRLAEKRDADVRGRGGQVRKNRAACRLGAVVFAAHPSNRPGPRVVGSARLRRRFVHRGRDEHCRQNFASGC